MSSEPEAIESVEPWHTNLDTLHQKYCNGQLVKLSVQRKHCWTEKANVEFLDFVVGMRNVILPILVMYTLEGSKEMFSIIDGNNRSQAILGAFLRPLHALRMSSTVGSCIEDVRRAYPTEMFDLLESTPLKQLRSFRTLHQFCRDRQRVVEQGAFDPFQWYRDLGRDRDAEEQLEQPYRALIEKLDGMDFGRVQVTVQKFVNMSEQSVIDVYEAVNKSGVKLSKQEIIKATSYMTRYYPEDVSPAYFADIMSAMVEYTAEVNETESIKVKLPEHFLSTHDLLFGLQICLHRQFPSLLDFPGEEDNRDLLFKVFEPIYGSYKKKTDNIKQFIERMWTFLRILDSVDRELFNGKPNNSKHGRYRVEPTCLLLLDMWSRNGEVQSIEYKRRLRQILLYHRLYDSDVPNCRVSPLSRQKIIGGSFYRTLCSHILQGEACLHPPTRAEVRQLLQGLATLYVQEKSFEEGARRKSPSYHDWKVVIMNIYFMVHVPPKVRETPLEVDHVIPVATQGWSGELDINRLGNLMMINDKVNLRKSNKPITNYFLHSNELHYYHYPTEEQYALVVQDGIVQAEEYNRMCTQRETKFFDAVLRWLFD